MSDGRSPARDRHGLAAGAALALACGGALLAVGKNVGAGVSLLAAGAGAAALATIPGGLPGLGRRWVASLAPPSPAAPRPAGDAPPPPPPAVRPAWVAAGLCFSALAALWTGGNRFTPAGAFAWAASIAALLHGLAGGDGGRARQFQRPSPGAAAALLTLTLLAGFLRLGAFSSVPPEPTSDHVEKALDAVRIGEGGRPVFCPTNGGREPLPMYLLALLALLPGVGPDLHGLTLLSSLEGTLTIPLFFFAGLELVRPKGRRAAELAGLAAAGLAAVSGWHVLLSRLGLRIVLLPAVTLLLLAFLLRAAREGGRRDWLAAGLVLGLGLYTYQAARFLPFLVAGAALLSDRGTPGARRRLRGNLLGLALVSGACAAPLARYALEFPDEFWARARTRMLGDAATADSSSALRVRLPAVARGTVPALAALHVSGDRSWFQGTGGRPFLDPATGGLLAAGLGLAAAGALRKGDRASLLVPAALVLLLLPSAVAAAFPIENPSSTRASGALAPALLLAGSGLSWAVRSARARSGLPSAVAVAALLVGAPALAARASLLDDWRRAYAAGAHAHREMAAEVAAFLGNGGRPGNVFVVGFRNGPDDRAIAMEAGLWARSPGVLPGERPLVAALGPAVRGADPRRPDFDPGGALLFLLSPRDETGLGELRALFPAARVRRFVTGGPDHGFVRFDVPPGEAARLLAP